MADPNYVPQVGDAATYTVWTDSHACTVVAVERNGKIAVLQRDNATRLDKNGFSESQDYSYERNPEGATYRVSRRVTKDGRVVWKTVGQETTCQGGFASFGVRREYWDPCF